MELTGHWSFKINILSRKESLDQRSTDWATKAVAVSLGVSSVYILYISACDSGEVEGYIKGNI